MNKQMTEFKAMNEQQLRDKINELRRAQFTLKLNSSTAHIKDYSQFKKIRRSIAQALTALRDTVKSNDIQA